MIIVIRGKEQQIDEEFVVFFAKGCYNRRSVGNLKFNNLLSELDIDKDNKKEYAEEFVKKMSDRFLFLDTMEEGSTAIVAYRSEGVCYKVMNPFKVKEDKTRLVGLVKRRFNRLISQRNKKTEVYTTPNKKKYKKANVARKEAKGSHVTQAGRSKAGGTPKSMAKKLDKKMDEEEEESEEEEPKNCPKEGALV